MEKFKDISVSIKQHLAYVEINRPPNNFFDANLIQQIADAYESLDEEDECRVILLKSEGKNFCAGANFGQDEDMLDKSVPYKKLYAQAVRLFRTRKPVIAIVQGAAIGGGLGLALSADFRVACHEARFAANFAKLRKVLCLDARSMADASAKEIKDSENDLSINKYNQQNVA